MDRFPEAFERFERVVDVDRFRSYFELALAFQSWAGQKWKGTRKQWEALDSEAENLGFSPPTIYGNSTRVRGFSSNHYAQTRKAKAVTWKYEVVNVKGKSQNRYRDLKTGRFIKKP
jgi:predicted glycosyltransferase involved in capsule biosynthesis